MVKKSNPSQIERNGVSRCSDTNLEANRFALEQCGFCSVVLGPSQGAHRQDATTNVAPIPSVGRWELLDLYVGTLPVPWEGDGAISAREKLDVYTGRVREVCSLH